ncbi:SAF domain-containing protein [Nocardioides sp. YIM 152315]|uniref:SAF domain-containing protein n=1 Tax=Nocardioides sp. YIM 152315 TaxID=3031760 RepID=UPI0023DC800B|nr:SAF domain-containing protein [Nocardioides sp. YIM 152315]MDF1605874.1 SAF domain-containing protein [Nocardioides sp. YIM 152315]
MPPPKLRRRPAMVVAAVIVTALGCLLGAWAWSATTDTREVLAARDTIHRGEVIEAGDIERVRISGDPALSPLSASAYDDVVGSRAALDIAAGGLLTSEATAAEPIPAEGQSVVGISLTPAQVPGMPLYGGDRVRIVVTPGQSGNAPAGSPQFTVGEVVDTSMDETTGNTVVNVLVPYADAGVLAARAASGNVALVLDSAQSPGVE